MKTGYCPKCGGSCEITFARSMVRNGKTVYPVKAKCFVIPNCAACKK